MIPALLEAALSDPRVTVGSIVLAMISTVGFVAREWIRKTKHARNNAAMVERTDREAKAQEAAAAAAVKVAELEAAPTLIDKIEKLWAEKDECKEALRSISAARAKDAEACREETASLREQLAKMAATAADAREKDRGEDTTVTRLRDLDVEVRRTPTPPGGMPAQPSDEKRKPPPPKPRS